MKEAVSDILMDRARVDEGMSKMLVFSLGAHIAVLAFVLLVRPDFSASSVPDDSTALMITLGMGTGTDPRGMTPIAGRAVQEVAPPETKARTDVAPAPKAPEMVEPTPTAKPAPKTPAKPVEKPADTSRSRTPTRGAEVKPGAAQTNTGGAPIPFGGLSDPMGGGGSAAFTDFKNFCCPGYLTTMTQIIQRNWKRNAGSTGIVLMKFTITREGKVTNVEVEKPSGQYVLDAEAKRALTISQLPPLPREFPEDALTVHLYFHYTR